MAAHVLELEGVGKDYGNFRALTDVTLSVEDGEFIALVGPSGCGKTTLLKILAGFESPTKGKLSINGKDMAGVPPSHRPTRMVFQKLALFPHKTVEDNIRFPLKIAGVAKQEQETRVRAMFELMHLKLEYRRRFPAQLSGGEQQRVALARALISQPRVLLLDEPMSALDAKLKKTLQSELKRLHREIGTTFVLVTHDLEEAMMLADRICVMVAGKIEQLGSPAEIYRTPNSKFVAGFIGETNFLPVTITPSDRKFTVAPCVGNGSPVKLSTRQICARVANNAGELLVRPENVTIVTDEPDPSTWFVAGAIAEKFNKGSSTQYRLDVPGLSRQFVIESAGFDVGKLVIGQTVCICFDPAQFYIVESTP